MVTGIGNRQEGATIPCAQERLIVLQEGEETTVNSSRPKVRERRVQVSVGDQLARSSKCRKVGKSGIKQ
jgi:hypothetical protein